MSHTLTVSDATYQTLEKLANDLGRPMADVVAALADGAMLLIEAKTSKPSAATFDDEVAWMRHLGMSEESIARVLAAPVDPEPGEEYIDADL